MPDMSKVGGMGEYRFVVLDGRMHAERELTLSCLRDGFNRLGGAGIAGDDHVAVVGGNIRGASARVGK